MGVMILKLMFHINAALKKFCYKLIYGKRLQFGKKSTFRRRFYVYIEGDGRVDIGDDCFFNNGASLNSLSSITVGDRCVFGEDVKIYDHNHKFRVLTRPVKDQGFSSKPVVIGSDTWVCSNCVILQGVTIGSHCVIGANCLVYKDVPDNTIVTNGAPMVMKSMSMNKEDQ